MTVPATLREPAPLIFVSSSTLKVFARSRLTPSTLMDRGASSTFAAGLVRRSSAEILASRRKNSRKSYCHALVGAAPAAGGAVASVGAVGGGGTAVGAGAAVG